MDSERLRKELDKILEMFGPKEEKNAAKLMAGNETVDASEQITSPNDNQIQDQIDPPKEDQPRVSETSVGSFNQHFMEVLGIVDKNIIPVPEVIETQRDTCKDQSMISGTAFGAVTQDDTKDPEIVDENITPVDEAFENPSESNMLTTRQAPQQLGDLHRIDSTVKLSKKGEDDGHVELEEEAFGNFSVENELVDVSEQSTLPNENQPDPSKEDRALLSGTSVGSFNQHFMEVLGIVDENIIPVHEVIETQIDQPNENQPMISGTTFGAVTQHYTEVLGIVAENITSVDEAVENPSEVIMPTTRQAPQQLEDLPRIDSIEELSKKSDVDGHVELEEEAFGNISVGNESVDVSEPSTLPNENQPDPPKEDRPMISARISGTSVDSFNQHLIEALGVVDENIIPVHEVIETQIDQPNEDQPISSGTTLGSVTQHYTEVLGIVAEDITSVDEAVENPSEVIMPTTRQAPQQPEDLPRIDSIEKLSKKSEVDGHVELEEKAFGNFSVENELVDVSEQSTFPNENQLDQPMISGITVGSFNQRFMEVLGIADDNISPVHEPIESQTDPDQRDQLMISGTTLAGAVSQDYMEDFGITEEKNILEDEVFENPSALQAQAPQEPEDLHRRDLAEAQSEVDKDDGYLNMPDVPSYEVSKVSSTAWINENASFFVNQEPSVHIRTPLGYRAHPTTPRQVKPTSSVDLAEDQAQSQPEKKKGKLRQCKCLMKRLSKIFKSS